MKALYYFAMFCIAGSASAQSLETVIQKGHELAVITVATSPDSNYIATGSKDKSAKLWEVSTRREVRSFQGHEASVTTVAFSPDGKLLITGSNDKTIRIWEVQTGSEVYVRHTNDYITDVVVDPLQRFLVYAGHNNTGRGDSAVVLDFKSHRVTTRIPVNPDKGLGKGVMLAISPDGKWLALGEDNRKVQLMRTDDWSAVHAFEYPEGFCGGCVAFPQFSNDSRQLFVASRNGDLKVYTLNDLSQGTTILEKVEDLTAIHLSHDAQKLVLLNEDEVKVVAVKDGTALTSFPAQPKAKFNDVLFLQGDRKLIIASDNNTGIVFGLTQGAIEKPFAGFLALRNDGLDYDPNFYWQSHIARYVRLKNNILLSRDGKSLIRGKFGSKVKRWDIASGKTIMEYAGHTRAVLAIDQSRDGTRLLTGGGDGKIVVWNSDSGDSLLVIPAYREPVFDLRFNEKENQILSSSWDGTMKIHDAKSGAQVAYFSLDNGSAFTTAFHPSGLYTVTGRLDNSLQMWETDTRTVVRNFVGHTGVVSSIRFSKDGQTLLTSSWDGSVRRWDVGTGLMVEKINHGTSPLHTAIFDSPEKTIYSAGADRVIRIWEVGSGKLLGSLAGHNAEVTALALGADGKMLISHSLDGVTKFWNLESGKEFFEHIHLGENDWLVKNREGFFSGTDGARTYIHFVEGTKTYSVDQFFQEFYRPDLLPRIFQTRGGDETRGIYGKLRNAPPPELKIAIVPGEKNHAELLVRLINTGSGVDRLRILHNGKSLALPQGSIEYPAHGKHSTFRMTVKLIGGSNTFTAIASNKDNVESDPRSVEYFIESDTKHSNCYILAVGINEYQNPKLNLNYAKSDAVSLSKVIGGFSKALFHEVVVDTIFDKDATRVTILNKLDELAAKVGPEDVFIFYYAGHGSMVENRFYFIPTENGRLFDASVLRKQAIDAGTMQEKLKNIKALKQLIILDACQSGGSVELLAVRGGNEERAIAQLSRSTGIHVLASAGSEQFAAEFAELGHGLFTYVLVKGLNGEADGAPRDGKVTIYELKSYIDDQVPEMTRKLKGKPQYPYTFSRGHDFPVVIRQ